MANMHLIGVDQRAKEARAALNRLHWEVEWAIEHGKLLPLATMDLAEMLAIAHHIAVKLDKNITPALRAKMLADLEFYKGYHETPR